MQHSRWWRLGYALRSLRKRPSVRALADLARALRRRKVPSLAEVTARAKATVAYDERRYADALAILDPAIEATPGDVRLRRLRAKVYARMGSFHDRLAERRVIAALTEADADKVLVRSMEGRARELDQAWLPEIPGPPESDPYEPQAGGVLHLLKHSLPLFTNGYTVRSRYTLIAQRNAGLHPAVMTSLGHPRTDGVADFERVEDVDGIPHFRVDMGPNFPYDETPVDEALSLTAWLGAGIVREVRPQVIHARSGFRGYETALVGLTLAQRFDLPIVYEVSSFIEGTWSDDPEWAEVGQVYELRVARENQVMNQVDHVITIAETMRQEIVERGVPADRVTVIPNAVDADAFSPRPKDPGLVAKHRLGDATVIGYISNVGLREGFDYLVEATAILKARGVAVKCLIVGDGPELPGIRAQIDRLKLGDTVVTTGAVPHDAIQDHYALIDVFVIPRRDDHAARWVTPLKPFEAMAMGKPLLVADLPALVEVTEPGVRGLTFKPEDPKDLAARAEELIRDEALRRRFGEAAREWVVRERTWDANGRRYRDLYERILEQHRVRG